VLNSTRTWLRAITLGNGTPRIEQERAALERVTAKDVLRIARAIFKPKTNQVGSIGRSKDRHQAVESSGPGKLKPFIPGR